MLEEKLKQIVQNLCAAEDDVIKCQSGNASAGRRARKTCMEATKDLKELRSLILEILKK